MPNLRKKLIEVALPLEAINTASAREKSIRHGHPSTLHLWWARRPLAAARAVIFSQMVDDPSSYVEELRGNGLLRRRAEALLKGRLTVWKEATEYARQMGAEAKAPAPGPEPKLDNILAEVERDRLFKIIEQLVQWENTSNEDVLNQAREEIWRSWRRTCADNAKHPRAAEMFDPRRLPAFHDPFAGGGALPLEAQRLGLESYASDLNPVAVLINKAMIEIPPTFAGRPPVNPEARKGQLGTKTWRGAQGIAEDVRYYGERMRDEAENRIGHLYPKIKITAAIAENRPDLRSLIGSDLTVIGWLWARTVKSPNPAFRTVDVPLASTFLLAAKPGKEVYVEPVIEGSGYQFVVRMGKPKDWGSVKTGTKLARGANFRCVMSGTPIASDYIKTESKAGRMSSRLMGVIADSEQGKVYLSPTTEHEEAAHQARPYWKPEQSMPDNPRWFSPPDYGMPTYGDLFTKRQLVALTTFADLVGETTKRIRTDALAAGAVSDDIPFCDKGTGAMAYAEAIGVYLSFVVSRMADRHSTLCRWDPNPSGYAPKIANTFGRQALPMVWDHVEGNPFSPSSGNLLDAVGWVAKVIETSLPALVHGSVHQIDARVQNLSSGKVISADPPYYDNIGYADLSDFFYLWLRRAARQTFPEIFATLEVPKIEELVATPYRHGGKEKAEKFFLEGMTGAMHRLAAQAHPAFPVTIYYAFKQSESESDSGTASTGWETFLDAVILAGFNTSGTWPVRTELSNRMIGKNTNALASSIVLVCRPRGEKASTATRREFMAALQRELPEALRHLQEGNIAPVDLAQASIGPGMAVFTRYAKVLDAQGNALSVRDALALINETLDIALAEQEGDFDADSRWALAWFEQNGFDEGDYGVAETLSKAKNTAIAGLVDAGILHSGRGKVRLLKPEELPENWDPTTDTRLTNWETVHHLIRVLTAGGERAAADLVKRLGAKAEPARELAYRLYSLCERKKRATEALSYNALVQSWPEIMRLSQDESAAAPTQAQLF